MIKTIANLFGKILGSKAERDIQEIKPLLDKINALYPGLSAISLDELRDKTKAFQARIREHVNAERTEITQLSAKQFFRNSV
jgi:preprotein translocase subunit SecA